MTQATEKRLTRPQNATFSQLSNWTLEQGGIAVSWEELNEDLSVKGFLKQAAMKKYFIIWRLSLNRKI